ncbi:peptidoglycan DD-metalloendopeptidase family protein [Parashewanella tropica]|uniref:peptidoglycan DD-metalloendopeptidase family protein n=1 Tax=Parashewanella tropica TaxID=2547970 RepID=UPI001059C78D|nr:peptidoglycan DD-metalloendopeptidase family protein [Parashewanella tropica]
MLRIFKLVHLLPTVHKVILAILLSISLIIILLPSEEAQASRQTPSSQLETNTLYSVPLAFRTPEPPKEITVKPKAVTQAIESVPPEVLQPKLQKGKLFKVRSGDTLARLFKRSGLTSREVYEITQLSLAKKNLLKILPGENIEIFKDSENRFAKLSYIIDPVTTLVISKQGDNYQQRLDKKQVETRTKFATTEIKTNFWNAGVDAGLTPNQIMQLAGIFTWDVDFALDIREGDSFALIFEQKYADGDFLENGNILAAEFINQGDRYTAVRYSNGQYYSETGRSMKKAFIRSPVDFTRVSSNFNPRRLHPVTGRVRPHNGVDYVAPVGTPIKATGRGKVIASSYSKYNGNYVFIKHNDTYTTKYLHLKKRKVRKGQSIKQGQIIGTLGATGRVTGAHLHYEFIVNGVHRNPRTVKLPKADSINRKQKADFLKISKVLMAQLEHNKQLHIAGSPLSSEPVSN